MTLALSILLLAFGAVLVWGVDYEVAGMNLDVIGVVLLAAGALGALFAFVGNARTASQDRLVRHDYPEH